MAQDFDVRTYFRIARRRWFLLVIPPVVVAIATVVVATRLPRVYEATATVLIESQQIPTELASPTVTANALERIQTLQQRLMTRENLLQIADRFALYSGGEARPSPTKVVEAMRESIVIEEIDIGQRNASVIGFNVSFHYPDALTAAQVTNELVGNLLSQNLKARLSRATETSRFFEAELKRLERELLDIEDRIATFKRDNAEALPDTLPYRRAQLIQLATDIDTVSQRILAARQQDGVVALGDASVRAWDNKLRAKELELKDYEEQRGILAPLAERDVIPRNRIREIDRTIERVKLDIEIIETEMGAAGVPAGPASVKDLEAERARLQGQAQDITASIARTPQIEMELSALNREHEALQAEYRQAQNKMVDALTGERLEEDRQAERFEVIEQATEPDAPIKPDRKKVVMAGSAGGVALGFAAVFLAEMLDKSVRTAGDLEKRLQIRPIASIPYVRTEAEKRRRRRRLVFGLLLLLAAIAAGLAIAHTFYPLDLLVKHVPVIF